MLNGQALVLGRIMAVHNGDEILVDEIEDDGPSGEILEAPAEEVDPPRHLPTPFLPSAILIAKHLENHLPYAAWCDQCLEGRGREIGHK